MIETNLELRRLLTREAAKRLADASERAPARPGRLRRGLGQALLALGTRLAGEPARPAAEPLQRAGVSPGAWRSIRV